MNSSSVRSSIMGAAAVAAILDAIVLVLALVNGAVPAAILAIIAGLVCVGGASVGASRAAAALDMHAKQLERANSQVDTLTRQLNDTADYLNKAGATINSDG